MKPALRHRVIAEFTGTLFLLAAVVGSKYKAGGLCNRVTARHFVGVEPKTIEWAWIVEANRYATPKEIADLCKGKPLEGK